MVSQVEVDGYTRPQHAMVCTVEYNTAIDDIEEELQLIGPTKCSRH